MFMRPINCEQFMASDSHCFLLHYDVCYSEKDTIYFILAHLAFNLGFVHASIKMCKSIVGMPLLCESCSRFCKPELQKLCLLCRSVPSSLLTQTVHTFTMNV